MAVDFSPGSAVATALQSLVQPKLAECGWATGGDDTSLFEYILLMLANDKNEAQVASELSTDLLDLGPENPETQQFAHWLFEQIDMLRRQANGGDTEASTATEMDNTSNDAAAPAQDTEMEGAPEPGSGNIPTGPKAMRNGSGPKPARGGRMINQLNKQMNRTDDSALHRVRASQGAGRINSHSREPPKGPRSQNINRGLDAMASGRGMGNLNNMNMGNGGMNNMNGMNMGAMPGMMPQIGQNGVPGMLNPQQQMALMQMYEQQAQMMQQIFAGQTPQPPFNQNFQNNRNGPKRPLNERIDRSSRPGNKQNLPPSSKFGKKEGQDETMTDNANAANGDGMEVDSSRPDPSSTMCKFNTRCSKPDCPFVHQSPAAPEGTPVDMKDKCSYGAACTNKKCVGKHPSPAQRQQFQSDQECAFYPNCRDPANCPYKHPSQPPCRNGPDCKTPNCKFWHTKIMCKYTPCTNFHCPYKHVEGQKHTGNKVWVAPKAAEGEDKEHVSERKFVDEGKEEELIIPGQNQGKETTDVEI